MPAMRSRPTARRRRRLPFFWAVAAATVIGGAVFVRIALQRTGTAVSALQMPADTSSDPTRLLERARGVGAGVDSAPVKLLVFSDYMCPACRHFALSLEPSLRSEYIETGKVQLVYHDYPLAEIHPWSFLAARAARCAEDQNRFWDYHDRLFLLQPEWASQARAPVAHLQQYAVDLGLNGSQFESCVQSDRHAALVAANHRLGTQLGVSATPSLYMNAKYLRTEWNDYGRLRERIEQELGGAPAGGGG